MQSPLPATGTEPRPRLFETRIALIYATAIGANGIFLPYFPLWLETTGFTASAIAAVLAVPMFLRVVTTPAISAYADRSRDRGSLLILCVASTLVLSLGYYLTPGFAVVMAVSLGLSVVWPVQTTIADSIALSGVRRFGADYSRMRIWGSLSYLLANLAGGMILAYTGAGVVPALFSLGMAAMLAASLLVPRLGAPRARRNELDFATSLLRQPFFMLAVTSAGLIQASHAFVYSFSSIFWASLGIGGTMIGALWAFGVVVEVAIFALFTRVFDRLTPLQILYASGAASVLRWTAFPFIWPSGLGLPGFFAVQGLHGISTGLMIIGVQKMIGQIVPDGQTGTAQGISYFMSNFALALATLASGWLYQDFGAGGFFAMAAIAVAGLGFAFLARLSGQPQRAASGGWTSEPS